LVRGLDEATAPAGGECGPCTDFASYILAFALQLRKNQGKTSVRVRQNLHPQYVLYIGKSVGGGKLVGRREVWWSVELERDGS
jgi:hypothetical protein